MLKLQGNKVALIPVSDPDESGGLSAYRPGQKVTLSDGTEFIAGEKVSLVIPESAKERADQGVVKYVGPACKYVTPGSFVTYSGWSGTAFKTEDPNTGEVERLVIIPEDFIVCEFHDLDRTVVPGLYFLGRDGTPFEATYEQALELIGRMCKRERDANPVVVNGPRIRPEDYNKLRGG